MTSMFTKNMWEIVLNILNNVESASSFLNMFCSFEHVVLYRDYIFCSCFNIYCDSAERDKSSLCNFIAMHTGLAY